MQQIPPPGKIVTDFTTAKAGDVLDIGPGGHYRYLLLSKSPEYRIDRDMCYVSGRRWLFSRQTFTQKGIAFYTEFTHKGN